MENNKYINEFINDTKSNGTFRIFCENNTTWGYPDNIYIPYWGELGSVGAMVLDCFDKHDNKIGKMILTFKGNIKIEGEIDHSEEEFLEMCEDKAKELYWLYKRYS